MSPTDFGQPNANGGIFFHADEHARPIPFRMSIEPAVCMDHDDMMAGHNAPTRRSDDDRRPRRRETYVEPRNQLPARGKPTRPQERDKPRPNDRRPERYDDRRAERYDDRRDDRRADRYDDRRDNRRPQRVDDRRPSRYDDRDDRRPTRYDDRRPVRHDDNDHYDGHGAPQHSPFLEGMKHTGIGVGGLLVFAGGAGVAALGVGNFMHHAPALTSFGLLGLGAAIAVAGFAVMKAAFSKD